MENDYNREVYNGDLAIVRRINVEDGELVVDFESREVSYGFGELDELVLAYATTIHKIQGSEYPAVVIPLTTQHYAMLKRNLLYTGVTRGKRLVVLIGQRKALAIAVRNLGSCHRWSKLREWLEGGDQARSGSTMSACRQHDARKAPQPEVRRVVSVRFISERQGGRDMALRKEISQYHTVIFTLIRNPGAPDRRLHVLYLLQGPLRPTPFTPLVDYIIDVGRARALAWRRHEVRVVKVLVDFLAANAAQLNE